ncbi:MAG: DctP family TRAP transporter solute-binding subunit [Sphaerochaetaceae bacterium]|nr:DctP family TRAP transporter solute-binding subunit [Sphaerochaetaceae bacterium]
MKRVLLFVCVALMALPLVFANGSGEVKTVELAASTGGMSAGSPAGRAMATFADKVSELSEGSIEIKVFYDTTLGNASSMINGLQQGTVDIGVCGDAYYSGLVPEIQAFELPYIFESVEDARTSLAGEAGQYVFEKLEQKGIQPLVFWEIGFRQLTNNTRAVVEPADLKGVKLRCLPSTFQVKAWEYAGAIPVPMDVSELYSSLQQGVVDGQENPLSEIYTQGFHEVQKYISLTNHVYTPMLFSVGGQSWARLTVDQQQILKEAAMEAQAEVYRINDEENAALLQTLKDAGMEVEMNPDKEAFKELMQQSYTLFIEQYGDQIINMLSE